MVLLLFTFGTYFGTYRGLAKAPSLLDADTASYRVPGIFPTKVFWLAEQIDQQVRPEWWIPRQITVHVNGIWIRRSSIWPQTEAETEPAPPDCG